MFIIQTLLSSFFIWCFVIAVLGFLCRKKEKNAAQPFNENKNCETASEKYRRGFSQNIFANEAAETFFRFAVVICAHDEENVISNLLENLQAQNYPAEKFHVFVLADHCNDGTLEKAKSFPNVTVWERTVGERSGKGAVLNWGMEKILQRQSDFDCVLFFDADNQIRPDFLQRMNGAFAQGAEIVTGRRLAENPYDSLISQWYTLYWAVVNSLYNRPRQNLGLSSMLSGTGFAFRMELLQVSGWKTYSLSEDIEFTFLENLKGHCVTYLNEAIFYDEQPVRLPVMWKQLRRWCTGDFQIAFRYFGEWVKAFVKNPSWRLWDIFMGVGMTVCFGLTAVSYLLHGGLTFPVFYSLFSYISLFSLFFPQKKWERIEHKSSRMHF